MSSFTSRRKKLRALISDLGLQLSEFVSTAGAMASALQRLITERKAEMRWSYGDIARRGGMSRSTVRQRLCQPVICRQTTFRVRVHNSWRVCSRLYLFEP